MKLMPWSRYEWVMTQVYINGILYPRKVTISEYILTGKRTHNALIEHIKDLTSMIGGKDRTKVLEAIIFLSTIVKDYGVTPLFQEDLYRKLTMSEKSSLKRYMHNNSHIAVDFLSYYMVKDIKKDEVCILIDQAYPMVCVKQESKYRIAQELIDSGGIPYAEGSTRQAIIMGEKLERLLNWMAEHMGYSVPLDVYSIIEVR